MRGLGALVVVLAVAFQAARQDRQIVAGSGALPYSAAVKTDGLIYVAGTMGVDADGKVVKGDIKAQTRQAIENVRATLTRAGSDLANVASVTVYLRSAGDFAAMNDVYAAFWSKDPPARTTVVVSEPFAVADGLVEIAMIAVPAGTERVVVHPSGWLKSANPYSYGIRTGNTLFLAGLVSRNGKDNTTLKGDMAAQTRTIMENGAAILTAAGFAWTDVVSARVFVTDDKQVTAMNTAYREVFPSAPPVRSIARVGLTTPDYLVEITMVAVKDATRRAFANPADRDASAAIRAGHRLYLSGFSGTTGDVKTQTRELLARAGSTLKAAGFAWSDVVDNVVYLSDMTAFPDMNAAYREVFTRDFPARATVGATPVGSGAAVEMMLTAAK